MLSVPYSRMLFGVVPWYSFLIVIGAAFAVFLASKEEKRAGLPKGTIIDFALIALPCGIIGARIYYVAFSWPQFKDDLLSILRVWEGGIAIYGAVIAGLLAGWFFCRVKKISFLALCDVIAPGLILAQALGRWGNYFNQEAYGLLITNPSLCFFPFGVQIQGASGLEWHMATFFYESLWNIFVFIFLMIARRKWFRYRGDVFFFYAFLYACGRLIIEDFRMDSLYASSSIRISQLLSVIVCLFLLIRYVWLFRTTEKVHSPLTIFPVFLAVVTDLAASLWLSGLLHTDFPVLTRFLLLAGCSTVNIISLFILYGRCSEGELIYADIKE